MKPAALQTLRPDETSGRADLDEFRVASPREIAGFLTQLSDNKIPVALNAPDGDIETTLLWTVDAAHNRLAFWADASDAKTRHLVERPGHVVVAYLHSVKLQFEIGPLVLERGDRVSVLSCALPSELFRFQRRNAYRVRPLMGEALTARLSHPDIPDMPLELSVLDLSLGGCALLLPDDIPVPQRGAVLRKVEFELDVDIALRLDLRVQNVAPRQVAAPGMRIGCEFIDPKSGTLCALQRFVDDLQKRRRAHG
ncbi:MAG: flagellar regulator YcgR PilZN domain-containing protein [Caldimonas sp.]